MRTTCVKCESPLEQPATGRPKVVSGVACRRPAEAELKRIHRALESEEERLRRCREQVATTTSRRHATLRLNAVEAEVQRLEARLLKLLGDSSGDDQR